MQKVITKYGLAAHLAILAVAPLFLSPLCVLWLTGLAAIWLLMEPSRIGGEMLHDARWRVKLAIVRDPLFWFSLVVVAYAATRFLNDGVALVYDAENSAWSFGRPKMPILPGSVTGMGAVEFAAAVAMLVILQGCRHGLGKAARMVFLLLSSSFSGLCAVTLGVMIASGSELAGGLMRCDWLSPVFLGSIFGVYLLIGTVAVLFLYERKWRRAMLLVSLSVGGNVAGLFLFAPPAVHLLFLVGEALILLYLFVYARKALPGSGEFKVLVTFSLAVTLGIVFVVFVMPEPLLQERLKAFETRAFFPDGFWTLRKGLSDLSLKIWKDYPWVGSGLGAFPLGLKFFAEEADWILIQPQQTMPLNGYWGLLVERGVIGALVFVCVLGFLAWTFSVRLIQAGFRALPHPACLLGPIVLIVLAAESMVDGALIVSGMTVAVTAALSLSAGFFQKERRDG